MAQGYFYRSRFYSPTLQRFISADPIGLRGGINNYSYVLNSPLNLYDPLGLNGFDDFEQDVSNAYEDVSSFVYGSYSYFRGIYRAGRNVARLSGLMGDCEQEKARLEAP